MRIIDVMMEMGDGIPNPDKLADYAWVVHGIIYDHSADTTELNELVRDVPRYVDLVVKRGLQIQGERND